ncbi:MAG: hypothetical protein HY543_07450, partial [Deltaproteobacteria bacterium]|nr:hypothetical protein [Deltaproteobacteria bacterium]
MRRSIFPVLAAGLLSGGAAVAQQVLPSTPAMVVVAQQPLMRGNLGGGFIEYLFGDTAPQPQMPQQYTA